MAPNEKGACRGCATLDWECICGLTEKIESEIYVERQMKVKREIKNEKTEESAETKVERDLKVECNIDPNVDSESDIDFEDVVTDARTYDELYGVSWKYFKYKDVRNALVHAVEIASDPDVHKYYIGVAKTPALRFFENPEPHCIRFQAMYVLLVGCHMGKIERACIKECRRIRPGAIENRSNGGENINMMSTRFLYICVRKRCHLKRKAQALREEEL